jgi:predicted Holliday junction resolvase-like endonuclease
MYIEIILMLVIFMIASVVYYLIVGYQQISIELQHTARFIMRLLRKQHRPTKPSKLGERDAKW